MSFSKVVKRFEFPKALYKFPIVLLLLLLLRLLLLLLIIIT